MRVLTPKIGTVLAMLIGAVFVISCTDDGAQAQLAPRFHYDPTWPDPLPNLWKLGGVTGLAVDRTTMYGSTIGRTTHYPSSVELSPELTLRSAVYDRPR